MKKISYKEFQSKVYASLIKYKHDELGIKEKGFSTKKVAHDCLFPDSYWPSNIPMMLYKNIIDIVKDIQECPYSYKPHIAVQRHVASSQTACLNLFIPILESDHADCIIKESGVAPVDFDHIDRTALRRGYCFEYWESKTAGNKGLLGDHTPHAGTDSDVAICYVNTKGESCLWLIEHKLTEREFTKCGGYRSKSIPTVLKENCDNSCLEDICKDHDKCHYHKNCKYYYWDIMDQDAAKDFFKGIYNQRGCPFKGGMNQLWRNQMLALELERRGIYKEVYFSVVTHPENSFLDKTMNEYKKLICNNPKFSDFKSKSLVDAASSYLPEWAMWYKSVYWV